jgi:predicted metalloprotease
MRWRGERQSSNVEDRRGSGGIGGKHIGIGGVVLGLIALYFTKDPTLLLQSLNGGADTQQSSGPYQESATEAESSGLIKATLGSTEDVWGQIFQQAGKQYQQPTLVMFSGTDTSGCGTAQSAMGPFYCPSDQKVYIDLSFYDELKQRFGAPGDFAQAYVIAHEVGHHIQKLNGASDKMNRLRQQVGEEEYNKYSVKLELQADFLAGVWAHHAQRMKNILEENDIEEALSAANAIGDDRLQKEAQGRVVPESFTHGTSAQRVFWFKKGFETGDLNQGKYEDIR